MCFFLHDDRCVFILFNQNKSAAVFLQFQFYIIIILKTTQKPIKMTITKKSKSSTTTTTTTSDNNNFESQINIPQMHTNNTTNNGNTTKFLINFIESKIAQLRCTNFKIGKIRKCIKLARKSIGLQKSPKKKGYDTLITDEEKRLV